MAFPRQQQKRQPGKEHMMRPRPVVEDGEHKSGERLKGKNALITGGDSGIGRAVAVAYAKEGADIGIIYLDEHEDARATKARIEDIGRRCILASGDIGKSDIARKLVKKIKDGLGKIDVLVNNAAEQHIREELEDISEEQLHETFRTNIFSMFYVTQEALKYMEDEGSIINSTSVTAYRGSHHLLDYSATKGAIVSFTRSLADNLIKRGIRVNAVAPGPIWTPLIPASFDKDQVAGFGSSTPMGRAGQPVEVAPCYVFLASKDASYMTGQVLHPNGGDMVTT